MVEHGHTSGGVDVGRDVVEDVDDGGGELDLGFVDVEVDEGEPQPDAVGCRSAFLVARARSAVSEEFEEGEVRVDARSVVALDGSSSVFANGESPARYVWRIMESPSYASSSIGEDAVEGTASFFVSRPGLYTLQMHAVDGRGVPSCEFASVRLHAVEQSDVLILATWETFGDPSLPLGDTDVDLHLLAPRGQWNVPPLDCFWQNFHPEWGELGSEDDPRLDGVLWEGHGEPIEGEQIVLGSASESVYRLGVYVSALEPGYEVRVHLQVWVRGTIQAQWDVIFDRAGEFVHAFDIYTDEDRTEFVYQRSDGFPELED